MHHLTEIIVTKAWFLLLGVCLVNATWRVVLSDRQRLFDVINNTCVPCVLSFLLRCDLTSEVAELVGVLFRHFSAAMVTHVAGDLQHWNVFSMIWLVCLNFKETKSISGVSC